MIISARHARRQLNRTGLVLALLALLTGCGDDNAPTSPTTTPETTVEIYTGQLSPAGSGFYSYQVGQSGTATLTFASLTNPTTGRAINSILTIGVGVPAGEDCAVSNSIDARPGLAPQLTSSVSAGIYCVRLWDPGTLTARVNFAVRIQHP